MTPSVTSTSVTIVLLLRRLMLILVLPSPDQIRCNSPANGSENPVPAHLVAQHSAANGAEGGFS